LLFNQVYITSGTAAMVAQCWGKCRPSWPPL